MQHKYVMINKNIKLAEKYYTINYIWIKKQFYEVIRYTKLIFYIVTFHLRQKKEDICDTANITLEFI